jgi:hypothetical protein
MKFALTITLMLTIGLTSSAAVAGEVCRGFGPQTPRDIASKDGTNAQVYPLAPSADSMSLCNIHFHTNAEHKGPGFNLFAGKGEHGGFKCNETPNLTNDEKKQPDSSACHGLNPGDTIQVHWVHTSCSTKPGKGLGACSSATCANPVLRVESQVFLLVNDPSALNFANFDAADLGSANASAVGKPQAKALPTGTGTPVVFGGSTTGPKFNELVCSPLQATWSVRPNCAKLDINSLHAWCRSNVFEENHAHGVRELVTAPELLANIP